MWLKRPKNLTARQRDLPTSCSPSRLRPCAYTLSQQFDNFYEFDDPDTAEEYLRRWITEARGRSLELLAKFCDMVEDHWLGVIRTAASPTGSSRDSTLSSRPPSDERGGTAQTATSSP